MTVELHVPVAAMLGALADDLARWQSDEWPGFLHPGDLGWHSLAGADQTAADLRMWMSDGSMVAIGLLDGTNLLRMAIAPAASDDEVLATRIRDDLADQSGVVLQTGPATVEARGAASLQHLLRTDGWVDDEPWTPLQLDLRGELVASRAPVSPLRIATAGPDDAAAWTAVHWSSFKETPIDEATKTRFIDRWTTMATGPFADRGQHLIAFDSDDTPVAVTTVWSAGPGRPGLIEPMGVASDHRGKGCGTAITIAGAHALQRTGASSAVVVAEDSNPAAHATYVAAGFKPRPAVNDLRRPR